MQSETGSDDTVKSVSSQAFDWSNFLKCNRTSIIHQWVDRLLASGDSPYVRRPRNELLETVGRAFEANFKVITDDDYRCIDHFIDFITRLRLKAGFALQDVQQAFERYRDVVLPMVCAESGRDNFYPVLVPLNRCLAYTIFRFSEKGLRLAKRRAYERIDAFRDR